MHLQNLLDEITQIPELKDIHVFTDTKLRSESQNWQYYTHVPFVYEKCKNLLQKKEVNILEIGMGVGSSTVFSYFAKNKNFIINSIETEKEWYTKCVNQYYNNTNVKHHFNDSFDIKYTLNSFDTHYDLIFVDQGNWDDRNRSILYFLDKTDSFIIHDYDYNLRTWPDTHSKLLNKFKTIIWDNDWQQNLLTNPPTLVCTL
jgi:hypothetical protein